MKLCESSVDRSRLYFHGKTGINPIREILPPEPFKPFFVSSDLDYVLTYATYAPLKHYKEHVDPEVILVKLNPNARVFDPTVPADLNRLDRLNFWELDVLDRLASGADVLMVMEYAAHSILGKNRESRMGQILKGAGARTFRDYFCKQLLDLGYDMFKTSEDVDNTASEHVYGIINKRGFESFYPDIIDIETAKQANQMLKTGVSNDQVIKFIQENNQNEVVKEIRP